LLKAGSTAGVGKGKVLTKIALHLQKATKIASVAHASLQEAQELLAVAKSEHSAFVKDAAKLRTKHIEARAEALTELANLKSWENQRNTARRVHHLKKQQKLGKVTKMHCTTMRPNLPPLQAACTTQEKMIEATAFENKRQFSKTLDGAFVQQPMRTQFGLVLMAKLL